jgi:hypothetical protein
VAKKGAICPIFEGDMPPKKTYPQNWRQYWRHNRNPVKTYVKSEEYKEDIIVEILYHLSLKVFGSNHAGKSAYIQFWRTIHQFKVDLSFGIRIWAE